MKNIVILCVILFALFTCVRATAENVNVVDIIKEISPAEPAPLGQGTNVNPEGDIITADSCSLFYNNKPWMPVAGEFHYSRYPEDQWQDELLKIKAGGITIVPTYVFWIHHQETQGKFDWSGRKNLRRFIQLCNELGLLVIVRMGPWCHGEVRNGGLPDWVQNSGTKLRTKDPKFLDMVKPLYKEIARQIEGLLWKDGGPIIGVQHDNERNDVGYLLELKKIAREYGVDVPIYTMTGWNRVRIPEAELLPLFGAYSVAFWYSHENKNFRKSFFFSNIRDDGDMGAQFVNKRPYRVENINKYPYACCEIGGGMPSNYRKRVYVEPDEIAAMALVRLGCGSNMQGYYMYHGGINPDGLTNLNEEHPNAMPVKDYDFQAPLGSCGQVREHFFLLRMQHMFIDSFQEKLARMPLALPDKLPDGLDDIDSLRFSVRSDGKSGFIFFNNYQPEIDLPAKRNVQFSLKTKSGMINVPENSMIIPSGSYGILPFNMDCDGIKLEYATVQPVCKVTNTNEIVYFFSSLPGIKETMKLETRGLKVNNKRVKEKHLNTGILFNDIKPGTSVIASKENSAGVTVKIVVLTHEMAKYAATITMNGTNHLLISKSIASVEGKRLSMFTDYDSKAYCMIYPKPKKLIISNKQIKGGENGIFTDYSFIEQCERHDIVMKAVPVRETGQIQELTGTQEETWDEAAAWNIYILGEMTHDNYLLKINYFGDAARLYIDDKLYLDNYYNGKPMEIGLWNIPAGKRDKVQLRVLPYSKALDKYLPEAVKINIRKAFTEGKINNITIDAIENFELKLEF